MDNLKLKNKKCCYNCKSKSVLDEEIEPNNSDKCFCLEQYSWVEKDSVCDDFKNN
jgi:hypothetical protein